jgi:hypothetical protein
MEAERKAIVDGCFKDFVVSWNEEESKRTWSHQSRIFREFWNGTMMPDAKHDLKEGDLIPIIQILDARGKGTAGKGREFEGAAYAGIYQTDWYTVFRGLKGNPSIRKIVDEILKASNDVSQQRFLDELYEKNDIPALTGESAIVVNDFMFVYDPSKNLSALSLADRNRLIDFFEVGDVTKINKLGWGERIVETRRLLLSVNDLLPKKLSPRGLCVFFYEDCLRRIWKQEIPTTTPQGKHAHLTSPFDNVPKHGHAVGELIRFRGMDYGPAEENGVVFLFSKITEDLGIKVISIQKGFPDAECIKYNESDGRGYRIFIEFEYNSAKFKDHLEDLRSGKQCDYVVCWEHDWKECEKYVKGVICLRDLIKQLPSET